MPLTDRYDLTVSTASPTARDRFQDGMDRLLAYAPGAEDSLADVLAADPGLSVAHACLALLALVQGDAATARDAIGRARETVGGATRRERQQIEALAAFVAGDSARGIPACMACHGPSGAGNPGPAYPAVHGQDGAYVARRLQEYRAGTTTDKDAAHFNLMASVAKPLTDEEIQSLGSYVQGLHARAAGTSKPASGH